MNTASAPSPALPGWVQQILRCPVTGSALTEQAGPDGIPELVSAEAGPDGARLAYPVCDGIPVLLAHEARRV
ncbi:Trm112 family protein [Bogoriella caseilytica]|uniref:Uncharacterized protein n=1 Tax=Bogoriella caseilytica TaxID=56055 RepID=A0A3N2BAB5_9MICO|nr:hypothetical protein [Bogoriella caseilytica]ROR72102.1 hypothetical protein EDD31_0449 [Bogoriella caseilytica]